MIFISFCFMNCSITFQTKLLGSMDINVISKGFKFFVENGISCLKYNMRENSLRFFFFIFFFFFKFFFRSFWGKSDREDLEVIIKFFHEKINKKIILCGYSYGSVIASSLQSNEYVKSFINISYPFGVTFVKKYFLFLFFIFFFFFF